MAESMVATRRLTERARTWRSINCLNFCAKYSDVSEQY